MQPGRQRGLRLCFCGELGPGAGRASPEPGPLCGGAQVCGGGVFGWVPSSPMHAARTGWVCRHALAYPCDSHRLCMFL